MKSDDSIIYSARVEVALQRRRVNLQCGRTNWPERAEDESIIEWALGGLPSEPSRVQFPWQLVTNWLVVITEPDGRRRSVRTYLN